MFALGVGENSSSGRGNHKACFRKRYGLGREQATMQDMERNVRSLVPLMCSEGARLFNLSQICVFGTVDSTDARVQMIPTSGHLQYADHAALARSRRSNRHNPVPDQRGLVQLHNLEEPRRVRDETFHLDRSLQRRLYLCSRCPEVKSKRRSGIERGMSQHIFHWVALFLSLIL